MTTLDWKREAVGIEPWAGAVVCDPNAPSRFARIVGLGWGPLGAGDGWRIRENDGTEKSASRGYFIPDLSDPDTLAAFDRRLALRLGAPEEAVREGVMFIYADAAHGLDAYWTIAAGEPNWNLEDWSWDVVFGLSERHRPSLGTDDPLLARVRAWNSVKP